MVCVCVCVVSIDKLTRHQRHCAKGKLQLAVPVHTAHSCVCVCVTLDPLRA